VSSTATIPPTTGDKAKACNLIVAIETLGRIDRQQRPPSPDERQALARFGGFGAAALSILPDPIRGTYKDATWRALGEECTACSPPEEYDSAKRTTFDAFSPWPVVIATIHEGLARLGVPSDATLLEPGSCPAASWPPSAAYDSSALSSTATPACVRKWHCLAEKDRKILDTKVHRS
jgi:hypothetical protein